MRVVITDQILSVKTASLCLTNSIITVCRSNTAQCVMGNMPQNLYELLFISDEILSHKKPGLLPTILFTLLTGSVKGSRSVVYCVFSIAKSSNNS